MDVVYVILVVVVIPFFVVSIVSVLIGEGGW